MTAPAPSADPLSMMRSMVDQWEKLANQYGSQFMARPEAAQVMQGATSAGLQIQGAVHEAMAKVLSAANMPSKGDLEALGQRLTAVEASLARIEASLSGGRHAAQQTPPRERPSRGRKPAK